MRSFHWVKKMNRNYLLVTALALTGCTDSIEDKLHAAQSEYEQSQDQLKVVTSNCEFGPSPSINEVREEALAEWDAAAADNLENISPEQEWEIRKALADEMGLAPSEVNGWKDIYRGRAAQAKGVLENREKSQGSREVLRSMQQKEACSDVASTQNTVGLQKVEVSRLEQELKESEGAPGFFAWLGYIILFLVGLGILGWKVIGVVDSRAKQKAQLDGLLNQAQLFIHQLSAATRQEIVDAHARRDLAALRTIVRGSAPVHLREHII